MFPAETEIRIAVVGLGYVGLPLAVAFGRQLPTVGFDIDAQRIAELAGHIDHTLQLSPADIVAAERLAFSADKQALRECNVFVVTVPTPIDAYKRPDLVPLQAASTIIGRALKAGGVVVFESTVYPGATEEVCVPILERESGLLFNRDFHVGYSPERINPGDREHRLEDIVKVTSGSTPEAAGFVDALYRRIITAGTHPTSSIRAAEAAKVIENVQRDVNIALMNEFALIFHKLGLDTGEVLEAAGSKWNFLPFRPGLVGGHCIGVDPYYLTHKAQQLGHHPEVILAGRRINDGMGRHVARRVASLMAARGLQTTGADILVMGLTFKENCPDLRNTGVARILDELAQFNTNVSVHDPWASAAEAMDEHGIELVTHPQVDAYDAVILAVPHRQFLELGPAGIRSFGRADAVLFDVKRALPRGSADDGL